jgi:hypothetical protein
VTDCDNPAIGAHLLCTDHWKQCSVTNCDNPARGAHGKCIGCHRGNTVTTTKKRGRKKTRTTTVLATDPTRVTICCFYNCGKKFETLTRGVNKKEWKKTLNALNKHETRSCNKGSQETRKKKK